MSTHRTGARSPAHRGRGRRKTRPITTTTAPAAKK